MSGHSVVVALGLSVGAGLATSIGASVVFISSVVTHVNKLFLAAALGLSAGVMLHVSYAELFTESTLSFQQAGYSDFGSYAATTVSFAGGFLLVALLDLLTHALWHANDEGTWITAHPNVPQPPAGFGAGGGAGVVRWCGWAVRTQWEHFADWWRTVLRGEQQHADVGVGTTTISANNVNGDGNGAAAVVAVRGGGRSAQSANSSSAGRAVVVREKYTDAPAASEQPPPASSSTDADGATGADAAAAASPTAASPRVSTGIELTVLHAADGHSAAAATVVVSPRRLPPPPPSPSPAAAPSSGSAVRSPSAAAAAAASAEAAAVMTLPMIEAAPKPTAAVDSGEAAVEGAAVEAAAHHASDGASASDGAGDRDADRDRDRDAASEDAMTEAAGSVVEEAPPAWVRDLEEGEGEHHHLARLGTLAAISICLHNIPEGIATFAAALANEEVGTILAFAIALHNAFEGIIVAVPIFYATGSRWRAFLYATLAGIAEPAGALLAWAALGPEPSPSAFGAVEGCVAGIMVSLSLTELLPTARKYDPHGIVTNKMLVAGLFLMAFSLVLLQR